MDVLAKVGGFDLAGITGLYLGGAVYRIPIVVDGFISAVAALAAVRICEWVKDAMIVSHVSKEPGMQKILTFFGFEDYIFKFFVKSIPSLLFDVIINFLRQPHGFCYTFLYQR